MYLYVLNFVKSKLTYIITLMMVLGLINGYYNEVAYLKNFITPVLFMMIYPMMINLNIMDLFKHLKNPRAILLSLGINFIISPLLALLAGRLFLGAYQELFAGLILISLIPTSGMTASWTGLARGRIETALLMISVNLLASIIFIPIFFNLLVGQMLTINTTMIITSLLKVVIIPLVLGDLTRRLILLFGDESKFKKIKPALGGISSLGVALIVFIAISLKSSSILADSKLIIIALLPLILYYGLLLLISSNLGNRFLQPDDSIALVYGTEMRNLTIALGLSLNTFGGLAVFIIAIAYMVQVPTAAFYLKLLNRRAGF